MTEVEKLKEIARLFGGFSRLERESGYRSCVLANKAKGRSPIIERDWVCINAAIDKLREDLRAVAAMPCGEPSRKQGMVDNAEDGNE